MIFPFFYLNLMTFLSGERLISSTTVFLPSVRILNTALDISSSLTALLISSPGENFKLLKKFVLTIPGFIIQTLILLFDTSFLRA